jgi:large subunit ribosomal protein L21
VYAVVRTGGRQERVEAGQRLPVDLLGARAGTEVSLPAVLVVDGDAVVADPAGLAGVTVRARVLGEALGPKIRGFTYKPKTNQRRRWGHRQRYTEVEIIAIDRAGRQ